MSLNNLRQINEYTVSYISLHKKGASMWFSFVIRIYCSYIHINCSYISKTLVMGKITACKSFYLIFNLSHDLIFISRKIFDPMQMPMKKTNAIFVVASKAESVQFSCAIGSRLLSPSEETQRGRSLNCKLTKRGKYLGKYKYQELQMDQ